MNKIKFCIDYREYHIKEHFKNDPQVIIDTLDIGDIAFYYDDTLVVLIERKTINDLASSIVDGRHREQKIRLINSSSPSKVMYLIEGDIHSIYHKNINENTILGSIINTLLRDNIKVYRTDNIKDTIHFIERIYEKLKTHPHKLITATSSLESPLCYAKTIKLKKKDNLTPEVCNILQLSQIPGISKNYSKVILQQYHSIYHLCKTYYELEMEDNGTHKCETLLENIKIQLSNAKERRIGTKISTRIYHYLTNKSN